MSEDNGTDGQALANEGVTLTGGCEACSQFQTGSSSFNTLSNTSALSRSLKPQPAPALPPDLVNGTRDEALDICPVSEDLRERVAE